MYIGFNLQLSEDSIIWQGNYENFICIGKKHLDQQKAKYETDLKEYVKEREIDGTRIQNEWFPQIKANVFISHSHKDEDLACALAGWIYTNFGLRCFIDSNVWGYSEELLDEMNSKLSDRRLDERGGYLYNYQSCNKVSAHVNNMLSISLNKMIDKVEVVIFLNTNNSVHIYSDDQMNKTYSPWIYSEISCTQIVRKKPLLAYRDYKSENISHTVILESMEFAIHSAISYNVSLEHLKVLEEDDLNKWKDNCSNREYEYKLDALYEFICPDEVENTKKLFVALEKNEINAIRHIYSTQDITDEQRRKIEYVLDKIINRYIRSFSEYNNFSES